MYWFWVVVTVTPGFNVKSQWELIFEVLQCTIFYKLPFFFIIPGCFRWYRHNNQICRTLLTSAQLAAADEQRSRHHYLSILHQPKESNEAIMDRDLTSISLESSGLVYIMVLCTALHVKSPAKLSERQSMFSLEKKSQKRKRRMLNVLYA